MATEISHSTWKFVSRIGGTQRFDCSRTNMFPPSMNATTATLTVFLSLMMATPSTAQDALDVRVMSFNIRYGTAKDGENHWQKRRDLVFELLRQEKCDVLALQEVLRFQMDELLAALPDYAAVGVGRDDGKAGGEHAAILYRKSRFEALENATFWLSETPEMPGSKSWGSAHTRICTWARLRSKASGKGFLVFNVHLDNKSRASRIHSAQLIAERIDAVSDGSDPVILAGDFNAAEDSQPMMFLRGEVPAVDSSRLLQAPWVDTFRARHPDTQPAGTFNGFVGDRDGAKIDYILTRSRRAYVREAYILDWQKRGRYPSDHFPVVAHLVLGAWRTS